MLAYTVCIYLDICAESEFCTKHFGTYTPHNIKGRATNSVKNNRGSRGEWRGSYNVHLGPCPCPLNPPGLLLSESCGGGGGGGRGC